MLAPATEIVYDNQAYTGSAVGGKNPILQNTTKWHVRKHLPIWDQLFETKDVFS